jgi:AraC-like DNA-binding protein
MTTITDETVAFTDVVGSVGHDIAAAVHAAIADGPRAMAEAADAGLAALLPQAHQVSEDTTEVAERIAADPAWVRVEDLAAEVGSTPRQLQRHFADHVGISPKSVIRRYRLYEAAERARQGEAVDWATVAAELGYSDQAHLTRDFTASFGLPPGRYVQANSPTA